VAALAVQVDDERVALEAVPGGPGGELAGRPVMASRRAVREVVDVAEEIVTVPVPALRPRFVGVVLIVVVVPLFVVVRRRRA